MNIEIAKTLYRIMASGRMIVVRALVWNSGDEYESSQVEVLKICNFLNHYCALRHFRFGVSIDLRRNTTKTERAFRVSPEMIQAVSVNDSMVDQLSAVLTRWSKKEDLLLGRNEEKAPNPWVTAQTPFLGNVFHSPSFQRTVPASHPEMLPVLAMCFSSMSDAFVGTCQGSPDSELLANFGSFVAQARRESTRILYGTPS